MKMKNWFLVLVAAMILWTGFIVSGNYFYKEGHREGYSKAISDFYSVQLSNAIILMK